MPRPPPGLRGRDIGMWYAKQSKEKRREKMDQGGAVRMNRRQFDAAKQAIVASEGSTRDGASSSGTSHLFHDHRHSHNPDSYWSFSDDKKAKIDFSKFSRLDLSARNEMLQFRETLPVFKFQSRLLELIRNNQVIVVTGETGCGKTTQIPQYILDDAIKQKEFCRIVCTQPRRISAISVAERVAQERAEECGDGNSCGYHVKLQSSFPRSHNSILYCTTGIVMRCLQSDPLLSTITHIVLDEIHERDINSDFLITIIRDILVKRKDLKVILMSATLNAEIFSDYFDNCPMFHVPGFTYPVTEFHLEETLQMTRYTPSKEMFKDYNMRRSRKSWKRNRNKVGNDSSEDYIEELENYAATLSSTFSREQRENICCVDMWMQSQIDYNLIVSIIRFIVSNYFQTNKRGAILVFLPGWNDIKSVNTMLTEDRFFPPDRYLIIPLHSMMPTAQQKTVFQRPPRGVTKIVLSTNIAETSITIDDVVYVIDSGKIKEKNFEHGKNLNTLQSTWETKANAKQRSGRAGRVQSGYCFRLFTRLQEGKMADFIVPEIVRTPLDQVCLQIKILQLGKIKEFLSKVLEKPVEDSVNLSLAKLTSLRALDESENLTPLGYHLAQLPVEPQIGKMLLFASIFSCVSPILTIAACLSYKDPFVVPLGKEKEADEQRKRLSCDSSSDHFMFAHVFDEWQRACRHGYKNAQDFCWQHFLSSRNLQMIKEMRLQFSQYLFDCGFLSSPNPEDHEANRDRDDMNVIVAVVCSGLYPNVARVFLNRREHKPPTFTTKTEYKVTLHPKSVNSNMPSSSFRHNWVCFYEKMKTMNINLYDTSVVSPYSLLFFGGDLDTFIDENGASRISVDGWMKFEAKSDIADTIRKLRRELDKLLEMKIRHPSHRWNESESSVVDSITDLISRH